MINIIPFILKIILIVVAVPIVGGLLAGVDRILTAKMQRRKGPPLLQPFYDVAKLLQKESTTVNNITRFYVSLSLFFAIFMTVLFFMGGDLLLVVFVLTLSSIFFVIAGYSANSPYSLIGAERELLQVMGYEPMVLLTAMGFYYATGTFNVADILSAQSPAVVQLPLIFAGFLYILTFKLRKSPFDLSMSHHGHQEIVKGITTELTGICLAQVEITHWFETVFALGFVYIFIAYQSPLSHLAAVVVCALAFVLEIFIDNTFARFKWQAALKATWIVTLVVAVVNLFALSM